MYKASNWAMGIGDLTYQRKNKAPPATFKTKMIPQNYFVCSILILRGVAKKRTNVSAINR